VLALVDKPEGFHDDDESFMALYASQARPPCATRSCTSTPRAWTASSPSSWVVSHEIRTPLTSVKGAARLLSDDRFFKNTDQQAKLPHHRARQCERLLELINGILDFSKLEAASLR